MYKFTRLSTAHVMLHMCVCIGIRLRSVSMCVSTLQSWMLCHMLYLYLYNYISATRMTGSVIYSGYIALFVIEKRVLHTAQCNLIVPCSSYCGTYTV